MEPTADPEQTEVLVVAFFLPVFVIHCCSDAQIDVRSLLSRVITYKRHTCCCKTGGIPRCIDMARDLLPTLVCSRQEPFVYFALGDVGLPWANFCGDFAARQTLGDNSPEEQKYCDYFSADRPVLIPVWVERLPGKPAVFALNTAWVKYYQVDKSTPVRGSG